MLSEYTSKNLDRMEKVSRSGKKVEGLFRVMVNSPDLWLQAYANIYANKGSVTRGIDTNTLDGMSEDRITHLINMLKENRYFPAPVRRIYIPKSNGKMRPLGIPRGDDKLVQEVVRILLNVIYEPLFKDTSHGFRPQRSCHTALTKIAKIWTGVTWFVDMDIQGCFDHISHRKLIELLKQKIDDNKFISIIKRMLKAGYLEEWTYHHTYSGVPQGGILSPLLSNIYLHELDQVMEEYMSGFWEGKRRAKNPEWASLSTQIQRLRQKIDRLGKDHPHEVNALRQEIDGLDRIRKTLPYSKPGGIYKRLKYCRYADDFLIGVIGSKADAQEVFTRVKDFLKKYLLLTVATEKSGIHHGNEGTQFLGYGIRTRTSKKERIQLIRHKNEKTGKNSYGKTRTMTKVPHLEVPREKVRKFCLEHGYVRKGLPIHRAKLVNNSDFEIIAQHNTELRGIANYYALADKSQLTAVESYALHSLFKTLAHKHKVSATQKRSELKQGSEHVLYYTHNGKQKILRVFKLKHRKQSNAQKVDELPRTGPYGNTTELLARMNTGKCEYCGKEKGYFEVHHVRKLKDIKDGKEPWQKHMIARARKTLVLCVECHDLLHAGKLPGWRKIQ